MSNSLQQIRKGRVSMKSIKSKLVLLLILIGMGPLLTAMAYTIYNTVNSAFEFAEHELNVKTEMIEKEVSALMGSNFTALRFMAVNPSVQEYLKANPENRDPNMKKLVQNANSLFQDGSNIVVTENSGQQVVRSDDAKLVNLSARDYFQEAMKGNEYVSEVVVSKTTGLAIVVVEVPVKDSDGKVIGMIQRNYNISALKEFLKEDSDETTELAIFESNGKLISHSSIEIEKDEDRIDMSEHDFIKKAQVGGENVFEIVIDGEKYLISCEKEPQTGWIIAALRPYSAVEAHAIQEAMILGGMSVVMLIVIIFIAIFVSNKAVAPILTINNVADEISKGNLSLKNVPVESNDELGNVARAFATMTDKLNDFFHKARSNATNVAQSAENLNDNSKQSAEAANQIATAVSEFANATVGQQKAVGEANDAVINMRELLNVIADNSNGVASASNIAMKTAETGAVTVGNAVQSMESLRVSVKESSDIIKLLGEYSGKIGNIVETISGIAGQTNLLALNAAIEAARAGEHGRGFAVVAEEVRKLAEQSAEAAGEIQTLISDVQNQTEKAVESMSVGTELTAASVQAVDEAGGAFRDIVKQIDALTDKITLTTDAIKKAESGNSQIIDSVKIINDAAIKFSGQTQSISATTQELSASTEEIASASRQLADMADDLQKAIQTFKLRN